VKLKSLWSVRTHALFGSSICGVEDAREFIGKDGSKWCLCLVHVCLGLVLAQFGRAADGIIKSLPVGEVILAHGGLGNDVGQAHVEYRPRLLGGVIRSGRSLDAAPVSRDNAAELPSADLGLAVEDGLSGPRIPVLREDMGSQRANQNTNDSEREVGPRRGDGGGGGEEWLDHLMVVLAAMGVGLPLVWMLVRYDFFLPNVRALTRARMGCD
jgi:hypothetical protein